MSKLKKEHWFKFYYHRIMVSCAGWKDDEFGAYIKLLIRQFDKGYVPNDEKELKRIISSYKKNWELLSTKFNEEEPGKLFNNVMKEVRDEYDAKAERNRENGPKGGRPKKPKQNPDGYESETQPLSVSYSNSSSLEKEEGSEEEKTLDEKNETLIVPKMLVIWKKNNPKAFIRLADDSQQLLGIAKQLNEWMGLGGNVVVEANAEIIKKKWQEISEFLSRDDFLKKYSLVQVNSHFPSVIQAFNNKANGTTTHQTSTKHKGAMQLVNNLKQEYAARRKEDDGA
jgi:uncharacterized protein YdaU (DUF1376 family)